MTTFHSLQEIYYNIKNTRTDPQYLYSYNAPSSSISLVLLLQPPKSPKTSRKVHEACSIVHDHHELGYTYKHRLMSIRDGEG